MAEQDCIFCRLIAGELPADVVYQDGAAVAIRDTNPQAPVHLLVLPKEHIDSLDDAGRRDEPLLGHLLRVASRVANEHGLAAGYRTIINTGEGAGQSVLHLHVHVIGGRELTWPPG
jgi:histidine triad (HIT) family protein